MFRVAVAASGGRDSTALLHCTLRQAREVGGLALPGQMQLQVLALHVHHGLMPQADDWLLQVKRQAHRWGATFASRRLTAKPARGQSVEAWARIERYRALAEMAADAQCDLVLLAHHRRDQAETFLLQAKKVDGGYLVNGTLPWVSNLGPDHYFGAVADVALDGEATSEIMFVVRCDAAGVELRNCPSFSAMEGTNTWAVRLTNYFVGSDLMIADPVRPFIGRIRAAFILLQTGMGLGVAQGAIDSMWTVERQLGHVNEFLDDRPDDLQVELDDLTARIMQLAKTPFGTDKAFLIDVLDARAHASELALRAAQSALLHQGARGYLMTSSVQRRVRESHFVAIVTPAVKHLRKEIARLSAEEMPA